MSEFESGIGESYSVKVEICGENEERIFLTVDPVGQFHPGGCEAFAYVKKDALLSLASAQDIMDYFLKRICFENLETAIDDLDDFSLGSVLDYTGKLETDEENEWFLPYFKGLNEKVRLFDEKLRSMEGKIARIIVHQYHSASGELCDFTDYTNCPEGEEEEEIRSHFEKILSDDSDIDAILSLFEDGYFYGNAYDSDQVITADLKEGKAEEKLKITDIR